MLKRILGASVATAALIALSAPAFAATGSVAITGSVDAACSISSPTHTVAFGTFTMNSDGTYAGAQSKTQGFGDVWCNGTHNTFSVTAYPLIGSNAATDTPFTNRIDYTVSATVLPSASLDTTGAPVATGKNQTVTDVTAFDTGSGTYDQYTITTKDTGSNKLVAGAYSGHIDVTLTPGL